MFDCFMAYGETCLSTETIANPFYADLPTYNLIDLIDKL